MSSLVQRKRIRDPEGVLLAWGGRLYLLAGFVFLLLPIVTLVVFSFQRNQYASIPGQGWSMRWYIKLFSDPVLLQSLKHSLIVSPLAATFASVIGFLAAYA